MQFYNRKKIPLIDIQNYNIRIFSKCVYRLQNYTNNTYQAITISFNKKKIFQIKVDKIIPKINYVIKKIQMD